MYKTLLLFVGLLYVCEMSSPDLREENKLKILRTGSQGEHLDSRGVRIEIGECYTMTNFIVFIFCLV